MSIILVTGEKKAAKGAQPKKKKAPSAFEIGSFKNHLNCWKCGWLGCLPLGQLPVLAILRDEVTEGNGAGKVKPLLVLSTRLRIL